VALEEIDRLMVEFGFPVGPITLLDEVGMDVGEKVVGVMHEAFGDGSRPCPRSPAWSRAAGWGGRRGRILQVRGR